MIPSTPPADIPLPAFGWTHAAVTTFARGVAWGFFAMEVRGREHLPTGEPCLLCANHASHVDTFALATAAGAASERLVFLGARDYFSRLRWRRELLEWIICLVDFDRRSTAGATLHNLRALGACRDAGRIVVLFPEGTRSIDGRLGRFKPGAAMFADKLGMKVIPCHIAGTHAALRKGDWLPRPVPLRVTFGPPETLAAGPAGESGPERGRRYEAFMTRVQARVAELARS